MFLPTTPYEVSALGWDGLDVILVTGDAYLDAPSIGVAVVGKVLVDAGFRVGIIAQPDTARGDDIGRLGEPELFWGITGGCIDSMVANRTAGGRRRKRDDYTPGGANTKRPDRAAIVYSNLVRSHFKKTCPIVLGGIEASLRRIAHYDFWSDSVRRSILFDAKADYLIYGMAERAVVDLASRLRDGEDGTGVRGLCYIAQAPPVDARILPPFRTVATDKQAFLEMFRAFYANNDPVTAQQLAQQQDTRYLVQNPPAAHLTTGDLDAIGAIEYERDVHPSSRQQGSVRALDTIRFSITTHRGCYGECNFCAIAVHQGRRVRWRSRTSILSEAKRIAAHPKFKGTITDVGGPTANMYGCECARKAVEGCCKDKRCLFPDICPALDVDHGKQIRLLRGLRELPGVKKVVVASGIRHDMVVADMKHGTPYLRDMVRHHVSGQMKLAPEHSERHVLEFMGKPGPDSLLEFRKQFFRLTAEEGKKQFLTYYMIAAHPGCTEKDMQRLRQFATRELKLIPEQVQVFTPTPSTYSTCMYWTGLNPFTGEPCFVERADRGRTRQKHLLQQTKRAGTRKRRAP